MGLIIGLGSNIGRRKKNIENAISHLIDFFGPIISKSHLYSSKPHDGTEQPDFLNMAIEFTLPNFSPYQTLEICLDIEIKLKRIRYYKWGPRNIDIDILFFGNENIKSKELTIPHPEISKRDFILLPLSELSFFKKIEKIFTIPSPSSSCFIIDQLKTEEINLKLDL